MKIQTFEYRTYVLAVATAAICFVSPLVLVAYYDSNSAASVALHTGEATVGIGVIMRATLRRLFRATARSFFRTTFSTVTRTSSRAFTRRFVRFVMKSLFGLVVRQQGSHEVLSETSDDAGFVAPQTALMTAITLLVSFAVLSLSFWGVVTLSHAESNLSLSVVWASLLAGVPILYYGLLNLIVARSMNVPIRFSATLDALLLQGYFTGAGSFLPMTTDVEYGGTKLQKARLAAISLLMMYGMHLLLLMCANSIDSPILEFTSSMFLIYVFVYSFPIAPLEGHHVWVHSKWLWLILFLPILLSFFFGFPEQLTQLL